MAWDLEVRRVPFFENEEGDKIVMTKMDDNCCNGHICLELTGSSIEHAESIRHCVDSHKRLFGPKDP